MGRRYWICHGRHGGLAVSNLEPDVGDYVAGPFTDHHEAFEHMQRLEDAQARKQQVFEACAGLALVGIFLAVLKVVVA